MTRRTVLWQRLVPVIVAALLVSTAAFGAVSVYFGAELHQAQIVSHKTGVANQQKDREIVRLLRQHSVLLHEYDAAATGIDAVAGPLADDVALICQAEHLACKKIPAQAAKP